MSCPLHSTNIPLLVLPIVACSSESLPLVMTIKLWMRS
jgi:hypothetical protein